MLLERFEVRGAHHKDIARTSARNRFLDARVRSVLVNFAMKHNRVARFIVQHERFIVDVDVIKGVAENRTIEGVVEDNVIAGDLGNTLEKRALIKRQQLVFRLLVLSGQLRIRSWNAPWG